ncbi:MAG: response regulator [Candidatus Pacearchaeota archaeon]
MKKKQRISVLFVDDSYIAVNSWRGVLESRGYDAISYSNFEDATNAIEDGLEFDIAIVDRGEERADGSLSCSSGDALIQLIGNKFPGKPVIPISGYATDCPYTNIPVLVKPFFVDEFERTIAQIVLNTGLGR